MKKPSETGPHHQPSDLTPPYSVTTNAPANVSPRCSGL